MSSAPGKVINIASVVAAKYGELLPDEKAVVNTYLILLLVFVIAMIAVGLGGLFIQDPKWEIVAAIFQVILGVITTVMVAIIFSVGDRLSIVAPVERQLMSEVRQLKAQEEKILQAHHSIVEGFMHYEKYSLARNRFGFNSIVGVTVHKSDGEPSSTAKRDNFALRLFDETAAGGEISILNSFITDDDAYYSDIKSAVNRGVNVRLLLMYPSKESPVALARWRDCYALLDQYTSYDEFIDEVYQRYLKFARLHREIETIRARNPNAGSYEFRTYDISLNLPLILQRQPNSPTVDAVYSGFYTGLDAHDMPFIEWRGGDFRIGQKFNALYDMKWDGAFLVSVSGERSAVILSED